MSEVNPTAPQPPHDGQKGPYGGIGKKPKGFGKDSPIDAGGKNFGSDSNWFNNMTKQQHKQFMSNLSQSITAQMKKQQQQEAKDRRKLKASEQGKDPSSVD
ncbi:hypothetical protein K0U07_03515 [bacterium]|nr:hypothetical protein [bacterium]